MVIVIILLWIGSAVAGWNVAWIWLLVPVGIMSIHVARTAASMKQRWALNGMPTKLPAEMRRANGQLLAFTFLQHLAIFGIFAIISSVVN
jgi:hypothetical protein